MTGSAWRYIRRIGVGGYVIYGLTPLLAARLLTLHNLHFYAILMIGIRTALAADRFPEYRRAFLAAKPTSIRTTSPVIQSTSTICMPHCCIAWALTTRS